MPSFQELAQFVSNVGVPASVMAYLLYAYGKELVDILRMLERILEAQTRIISMLDSILDRMKQENHNAP